MACEDLYRELCSFRNLELAYRKARKGKRKRRDVQAFELCLEENLLQLKRELETYSYEPQPLKQFVIRDPKTRVISASDFRDRIVHHTLCNIIQPIFERAFIHDSYANRIGKGTHAALLRFDFFKRKVSQNGRLVNDPADGSMVVGYVLKADIRHYFDTVDNQILMRMIGRKISDENVLFLIRKILSNHAGGLKGKGMPLGNLTSQFFANLYLNELDQFVKHSLKAKYYIRYVDDFVILHSSEETLHEWKAEISCFLKSLGLELHPEKSKVCPLHKGTGLLGYRIFYHHKLPKRSNIRTARLRMRRQAKLYGNGIIPYERAVQSLEGWMGYASHSNSYGLRKQVTSEFNSLFGVRCK